MMENYLKKNYKTLVLSIICGKCRINDDKIFKEEESIRIKKVFDLINNMKV